MMKKKFKKENYRGKKEKLARLASFKAISSVKLQWKTLIMFVII